AVLTNSDPNAQQVSWSPYQKFTVERVNRVPNDPQPALLVQVNNTGYQAILDLRPAATRARPDVYTRDWHGMTQYDVPYLLHDHPHDVLIVGAGTGNDVAGGAGQGGVRRGGRDDRPTPHRRGVGGHPPAPPLCA